MNRLDLDGGSGGPGIPGGGGGGNPGTPTGSSQGGTLPSSEVGGVFGFTYFLFVPVQSISTGACYIGAFDPSSFDDPVDGSSYSYRQEDVKRNRVPTVNRVILIYKDLGLCLLTVTVSAVNDLGQVVSTSVKVQIGNAIPTGALITKFVDIQQTGFTPQLTISRAAGGGPFAIVSATLRGEVELNQ